MIKLKALKSFNKEFEIKGILDEERKILILNKSKNYEAILNITYNPNDYSIEVIGINNKRVTIYGLNYLGEYNNFFIYNTILIGVNCENLEEILDITEVAAKIRLNPKKYFNLTCKNITFNLKDVGKFIINNKYIKIEKVHFREADANSMILKMMEFISIMLGEFPDIEYFKFKSSSKGFIRKYFDINGLTNTSSFFLCNNAKMVDFTCINGKKLKKLFIKYCELVENDDIQLRSYFISQSDLISYSDYRLSYLLQAIEGFSRFAFNEELKKYSNEQETISNLRKKKSEDIKLSEIEEEELKYRSALEDVENYIKENFEGIVLKRLNGFFNYNKNSINFTNILKYWLENDIFVSKIFENEIDRDESCENFISKNKLVSISGNERNRVSHAMKRAEKKEYFSLNERKLYIFKYTIMFRYIVLKKLGVDLSEKMKRLNLINLNNDEKNNNCKNCSKTNCRFNNNTNE